MRPNVLSRLTTETVFIRDLIADVKKGEIKVPQFQRRFVWKEQQALELLDSVANNYPVGSLLLWRTTEKLAVERNIGDFRLPDTPDLSPTNYVLDGQQRLTVIYSCLGAEPGAPGFAAAYDLAEEQFVQNPPSPSLSVFPLRTIFDTTGMLNFRTALQAHPEGAEYQSRLDLIIQAFNGYKLPIVTLKDLTVEEVCPIFERINKSGTKLSTYDLMVAATWSTSFSLDDEIEAIRGTLVPKGFGDIDPETVLKCLAAVQTGSIKRDALLGLRRLDSVEMNRLVTKTSAALLATVDALSTEFGVYSWDFLPYEAIAVIMTSLYSEQPALEPEAVRRLQQWFWQASFSERYRRGGESFVSNDIGKVREFVLRGKGNGFGPIPTALELKEVTFRANNSRSRAFVLALALARPRNLTNGALIDTAVALSAFNRKQFHHIHPRAHLRRLAETGEPNCLANICMLAASENNRVGDIDPATYLPNCIDRLGDGADAVFATNLLPLPSEFDYRTATYEEFLDARAAIVAEHIRRLCVGA